MDNLSFTWSVRNRFIAFSTSGLNFSSTFWRKAPSFQLLSPARRRTISSDGSLNSSDMNRLMALTYLSSSALLAMESMSNDGFDSFCSSGRTALSMSRRSRTRERFRVHLVGPYRGPCEVPYLASPSSAPMRAFGACKVPIELAGISSDRGDPTFLHSTKNLHLAVENEREVDLLSLLDADVGGELRMTSPGSKTSYPRDPAYERHDERVLSWPLRLIFLASGGLLCRRSERSILRIPFLSLDVNLRGR